MNELNDQNLSNLEFIKNYDPQKGVSVSSGKLITPDKSNSMAGIPEEFLQCVNDSLNYTIELCNKKIMDLSQVEDSSPYVEDGEDQIESASDKVNDLLLLIDESNRIKNALTTLISASGNSGLSTQEAAQLKTIANAYLEQFSQLLNKSAASLQISSLRADPPIDIALKVLSAPNYQEEFKKAIDQWDKTALQTLLSQGADINMTFDDGTNPLTLSILYKNNDLANFLISAGADINSPDANGDYPFLLSIETDNQTMTKSFLNNPKVDLNVQNQNEQGATALIMGCYKGDESLVQELLNRKVDIHKPNNQGQTAVFTAAANGHDKIVSLLIQNGADLTIQDNSGVSPLIASVYGGHFLCVRLILNEGIKPDAVIAQGGNTALHVAAYLGQLKIRTVLLQAGADPFKLNDRGETPFDISVKADNAESCKKILMDIDFKNLSEEQKKTLNEDEMNELKFIAASEGMTSQLNDLIALFPDVNITSKNGETLLMAAVSKGQIPTVSLLLKKGAKASGVYDGLSHDPLIKAAFSGSLAIISDLLDHGADPLYRDSNGFTALEYIVMTHFSSSFDLQALFPQSSIDQTFQHLGMSPAFRTRWTFLEIADKLAVSRSTILHNRLEVPVDDPAKIAAQKMYDLLCQSTFDVEQLSIDNVEAYTKLQAARMSGSTSITKNSVSLDQQKIATEDWKKAEETVRFWIQTQEPLTKEMLCELNGILNTKNREGKYHSGALTAGGNIINSYVPEEDLTAEVDYFMSWLTNSMAACDSGNENPIIVAALAYQRLVSIHPFNDGNGRTCRLVMDYILQKYNLPPSCPNDVRAAIFVLIPSDMTPSKAVMNIVTGLENSYNIFKGQT